MRRILVTGGAGFVAAHLTSELLSRGCEVALSDRTPPSVQPAGVTFHPADLTNSSEMMHLVASVRPDAIVHLGAISFVPEAARNPALLLDVNVKGTTYLLEGMRLHAPKARFLFVSTAQVLGEKLSHYASSKFAAEQMVENLGRMQNLDWLVARPANHTGPAQTARFVVPSFVEQAVKIRSGNLDHFTVGNLEAVRDFTDVRDVVRAYCLLLEKGETGGSYTIGSNQRLSMGELLAKIQKLVGVQAPAEVDPKLWRPTDASPVLDVSRITSLGWRPAISLDQTLCDMIDQAGLKVEG